MRNIELYGTEVIPRVRGLLAEQERIASRHPLADARDAFMAKPAQHIAGEVDGVSSEVRGGVRLAAIDQDRWRPRDGRGTEGEGD